MKRKSFYSILAILLLAVGGCVVSSCHDDDELNSSNEPQWAFYSARLDSCTGILTNWYHYDNQGRLCMITKQNPCIYLTGGYLDTTEFIYDEQGNPSVINSNFVKYRYISSSTRVPAYYSWTYKLTFENSRVRVLEAYNNRSSEKTDSICFDYVGQRLIEIRSYNDTYFAFKNGPEPLSSYEQKWRFMWDKDNLRRITRSTVWNRVYSSENFSYTDSLIETIDYQYDTERVQGLMTMHSLPFVENILEDNQYASTWVGLLMQMGYFGKPSIYVVKKIENNYYSKYPLYTSSIYKKGHMTYEFINRYSKGRLTDFDYKQRGSVMSYNGNQDSLNYNHNNISYYWH